MTSSFGGVEKYKNLIVFAINGRNDVGFIRIILQPAKQARMP